MAVETKIGLVVGLGFITCFAVVLSHRGSGDQLSARMAYDLLSKQNVNGAPEPATPPETYARRQAHERRAGDAQSERGQSSTATPTRAHSSKTKSDPPIPTPRTNTAVTRGARGGSTNGPTASHRRSSVPSSSDENKKPTRALSRRRSADETATPRQTGRKVPTNNRVTKAHRERKDPVGARKGELDGSRNPKPEARPAPSSNEVPTFEALFGGVSEEADGLGSDTKRQADSKPKREVTARRGRTTPANKRRQTPNRRTGTQTLNREATSTPKIALGSDGAQDVTNDGTQSTSSKSVDVSREAKPVPASNSARVPETTTTAARYVVKSGDTLWRISKHMYGVGSRQIVDAILAANKERLTSPEQLRVGVELVLPAIEGVGAAKLVAQRRVEPTGQLASAPGQPRYYQIQSGDRYSTIAERFLGSKSRWKEIHEMNKDIFPDPGKIRTGVRIRLPSSARLASAS